MTLIINKLCNLMKLSCQSPAPKFQPIWQKWRKQEMLSSFKPRAMKRDAHFRTGRCLGMLPSLSLFHHYSKKKIHRMFFILKIRKMRNVSLVEQVACYPAPCRGAAGARLALSQVTSLLGGFSCGDEMPCDSEARHWSEDSKCSRCAEPGLCSEALCFSRVG